MQVLTVLFCLLIWTQRCHLTQTSSLFFILNDFHKAIQYELGFAKQEQCGSGKHQHPFFKKGQEKLLWKIEKESK